MMAGGMATLCCGAMGQSRGKILGKESVEGRCKQAGNTEEEGGRKIRMPMAHDNDDGDALLGVEGGLRDAMNAPKIMDLGPFPHPLLPALPKINIGIPCAM